MAQGSSGPDQLRKLTKVALHKRWSPPMFVRLCSQLQEISDLSPADAGAPLFAAANESSLHGPIDPQFLEYLAALALDPRGILPFPNLLQFLCSVPDVPQSWKAAILVYLAKELRGWTLPSPLTATSSSDTSTSPLSTFAAALTSFMSTTHDQKDAASIHSALAYFLIHLADAGNAAPLMLFADAPAKQVAPKFQAQLGQFIALVNSHDSFLGQKLLASYAPIIENTLSLDFLGSSTLSMPGIKSEDKSDSFLFPEIGNPASDFQATLKVSRASRLLWLESIVVNGSKVPGRSFIVEVHTFFGTTPLESVISDIILSAFDCLAVALQRKQQQFCVARCKGFIVKRLPLVIRQLTENNTDLALNSSQMESVVCRPVRMLDRETVNMLRIHGGGDALDEMFSSFPSTTSDIRHEFLQACIDIDIIPVEALQRTLDEESNVIADSSRSSHGMPGSNSITTPSGSSISIEEIMKKASDEDPEQVRFDTSTPAWVVKIYEELDGHRQERVAKVLVQYCNEWARTQNKAAMARFCQALSLNTDALDLMLLHIRLDWLLAALVMALNDLGTTEEDEDGGTPQEEFAQCGCIYLFIELVFLRYGFRAEDLKRLAGSSASFWVQRLLNRRGYEALLIEDMSDDRRQLLGDWITALFDAGGISDDLMRASSIQELIMLIPSVFQQAITACALSVIDRDVLKGGLDYFLQPFLLPMLLSALHYLADCLWSAKDVSEVLRVLPMLVSPSSGSLSAEAAGIHSIVLAIVSGRLKAALVDLKENSAKSYGQVDQLLIALEPHVSSTGWQSPVEQAVIAKMDVVASMKESFSALTGWIQLLDQGHMSGTPSYDWVGFAAGTEMLGARRVLRLLLDELDFAEAQGIHEYALDVATGLILALSGVQGHEARKPDVSLLAAVTNTTEEQIVQAREKKPAQSVARSRASFNDSQRDSVGTAKLSQEAKVAAEMAVRGFRRLKSSVETLQAQRVRNAAATGSAEGDEVELLLGAPASLDTGMPDDLGLLDGGLDLGDLGLDLGGDLNGDLDGDLNGDLSGDLGADLGTGLGGELAGFDTEEQLMLMDLA